MNINPGKSAYTTNGRRRARIVWKGEDIKILGPTDNYKYLGLPINLELMWGTALSKLETKFKQTLNIICSKRYLSVQQKVKLVNMVANPTIGYLLHFITPSDQELKRLDDYVAKRLMRSIHLATNTSLAFWPVVMKLRTLTTLSKLNYVANYLDRGLLSQTAFLRTAITQNLDLPDIRENPSFRNYLRQIGLRLGRNVQQLPNLAANNNNQSVRVFTDASLKKELGGLGIYSEAGSISLPAYGFPSSTNFEIQAASSAIELHKEYHHISLYIDNLNVV